MARDAGAMPNTKMVVTAEPASSSQSFGLQLTSKALWIAASMLSTTVVACIIWCFCFSQLRPGSSPGTADEGTHVLHEWHFWYLGLQIH